MAQCPTQDEGINIVTEKQPTSTSTNPLGTEGVAFNSALIAVKDQL
jgi:hypothetical protein